MSTTRTSGSSRWSCSHSVSTRGSKLSTLLLLSEEAVFAGEGLGQLSGPVRVVLGEAAFDDLALKKCFDGFDPTPRRPAEDAHEVVAVERALQLLDGVLGPYLLHPVAPAPPGPRRAGPSPPGGPANCALPPPALTSSTRSRRRSQDAAAMCRLLGALPVMSARA